MTKTRSRSSGPRAIERVRERETVRALKLNRAEREERSVSGTEHSLNIENKIILKIKNENCNIF